MAVPIVLEGGKLVDCTGGSPVENALVLIEGNPLLPGLWDTHVHFRDWMAELFLAHGVTTILDLGNYSKWILAQRDGVEKGRIRAPRIFACGEGIGHPPGRGGYVKDANEAHQEVKRLL